MMRAVSTLVGATLVVVALSLGACAEEKPIRQDFWWLDLDRAVEAATASGRPMLVVFR